MGLSLGCEWGREVEGAEGAITRSEGWGLVWITELRRLHVVAWAKNRLTDRDRGGRDKHDVYRGGEKLWSNCRSMWSRCN